MTDTRELVERLAAMMEGTPLYEGCGERSAIPEESAAMLRALSKRNRVYEEALRLIADIETPQAQILLIARAALTSGGRG